ncbi:Holliday junction resolvase RecU [Labeo rohita]|uniref:Holliday junction resolvase RecU n=1 Tax=Labeo rohita TaxID=84645 RepID=A0ABQ8LKD9_LABRO|nr:Holliday junction resolvase RecU [Labeo rohita]
MDRAFNIRKEHGLATVSQLYIDNNFASFTQLRDKFFLPSSHLFRYFQILNFIRKQFSNFPFLPTKNILDILDLHTSLKGSPSMRPLKALWKEELNLTFEENIWDLILYCIHSSSINARHTLVQFKVVHRVHWSRTKLNKIFKNYCLAFCQNLLN